MSLSSSPFFLHLLKTGVKVTSFIPDISDGCHFLLSYISQKHCSDMLLSNQKSMKGQTFHVDKYNQPFNCFYNRDK